MIKTFTIHAISTKEISPGKGSIIWLLSDETGKARKVSGLTELDAQGVIHTVHPVYSREVPLVQALFPRTRGDKVTIDFRPYNQTQGYTARAAYQQMHSQTQAQSLLPRMGRMVVLFGILAALAFGVLAVLDVLTLGQNFQP